MPGATISAPTLRKLSAPRLTSFRGAIETSLVRRATWDGRDHLVVPIVALVGDTVIYASNAPGPELVPLSELSIAPGGWNGRPVVPNHPTNASGSANEPGELETRAFGKVFHARIEDARLKFDVYLDLVKAETLDDAKGIITRCESGDIVEVSVGAYIAAEETAGELNGAQYIGIWRYIVPDHLAMLTEGIIGACSVEMGCGTRAATVATLANQNGGRITMNDDHNIVPTVSSPSIMGRFLSAIRSGLRRDSTTDTSGTPRAAELSNSELSGKLWDALYLSVPALAWIEDVFNDSKTVVYAVSTTANGDWYSMDVALFQRTFRIKSDEVIINDDAAPVERIMTYTVINAETPRAACACGSQHASTETTETPEENQMANTATLSQLAARLVTRAAFKGSTVANLEALGEETLRRLDEVTGTPADPPATPAVPSAPAVPPATPVAPVEPPAPTAPETKSLDQWLADAPTEVKGLFGHYQAQDQARRAALVSTLTAAQKAYSKPELEALSTPQLEKLAQVANIATPATSIDFSGRALPVSAAANTLTPAPRPYTLALNKGKTAGAVNTTDVGVTN
jgi:hypothetical protein